MLVKISEEVIRELLDNMYDIKEVAESRHYSRKMMDNIDRVIRVLKQEALIK
jgi:hypothetical protein